MRGEVSYYHSTFSRRYLILSNSGSLLINSVVLCAFGDACTGVRHEISTTMIRNLKDIDIDEFQVACEGLQARVSRIISDQGISDFTSRYEVDLRYRGQATNLTVAFEMAEVLGGDISVLQKR